jgi:hypothetical protein
MGIMAGDGIAPRAGCRSRFRSLRFWQSISMFDQTRKVQLTGLLSVPERDVKIVSLRPRKRRGLFLRAAEGVTSSGDERSRMSKIFPGGVILFLSTTTSLRSSANSAASDSSISRAKSSEEELAEEGTLLLTEVVVAEKGLGSAAANVSNSSIICAGVSS